MSTPSQNPETHPGKKSHKKWWGIWGTRTVMAWAIAATLALSSCEDKDPAGQFLYNSEAQSLHDINTSDSDLFLKGMLESVNAPRATTDSDAIQAFDNLYKYIGINLKWIGANNNVRCTYSYDDVNGKPSFVKYAFSAVEEDGYEVVSIRYIGTNIVNAQWNPMRINENIVIRKSKTSNTVYETDPNGPKNSRTKLDGDDITKIVKDAVPF